MGWYISYSPNHPYIKHIVTLCPTDDPSDQYETSKVTGSHRIHQDNQNQNATDLHYRVGTDTGILSYRTTTDWPTGNSPVITEVGGDPPHELIVDWDLTDNPVPYCTHVTITTEFILAVYNGIYYDDVYFTYPAGGIPRPGFDWEIITPPLGNTDIQDVTGGYVIGSFRVGREYTRDDGEREVVISKHRLQHQYSYFRTPELHLFELRTNEGDYEMYGVDQIRFGHSYGVLDDDSLWTFEEWLTVDDSPHLLGPGMPVNLTLDWYGQLPYPPGDDYIPADFDHDGDVDSTDAETFMGCFTGPDSTVSSDCVAADFDTDGDVDCDDWDMFKLVWTGPPAEPPYFDECPSDVIPPVDDDRGRLLRTVPNPFSPGKAIELALDSRQEVTLSVFTADGRRVAILADGVYDAGAHLVVWDGRDDADRVLSSGVYLIRIQTREWSESRKVVLIK